MDENENSEPEFVLSELSYRAWMLTVEILKADAEAEKAARGE